MAGKLEFWALVGIYARMSSMPILLFGHFTFFSTQYLHQFIHFAQRQMVDSCKYEKMSRSLNMRCIGMYLLWNVFFVCCYNQQREKCNWIYSIYYFRCSIILILINIRFGTMMAWDLWQFKRLLKRCSFWHFPDDFFVKYFIWSYQFRFFSLHFFLVLISICSHPDAAAPYTRAAKHHIYNLHEMQLKIVTKKLGENKRMQNNMPQALIKSKAAYDFQFDVQNVQAETPR